MSSDAARAKMARIENLKGVFRGIKCDACGIEIDEYTVQKNMLACWAYCDPCSDEVLSDLDALNQRQFGEDYLDRENISPEARAQALKARNVENQTAELHSRGVLTRQELYRALKELKDSPDTNDEDTHIAADELLLQFINDKPITRAYLSLYRWYA